MSYMPRLLLLMFTYLLAACQLSPEKQISSAVDDWKFREASRQGMQFQHKVLENQQLSHLVDLGSSSNRLHVYIEGDGRPWWTQRQVSSNPTWGKLVALELMSGDVTPSLYLGRPCYFNLDDPACEPAFWTGARYSAAVVASMNTLLDSYAGQFDSICIIGFSGGGALAMLLANENAKVNCVVTLAANLDIDRWADHHGYTRLDESLNPAEIDFADLRQLHLSAGNDEAVPAYIINEFVEHQRRNGAENIEYQLYPRFDHQCCWQSIWPSVLQPWINDGINDE